MTGMEVLIERCESIGMTKQQINSRTFELLLTALSDGYEQYAKEYEALEPLKHEISVLRGTVTSLEHRRYMALRPYTDEVNDLKNEVSRLEIRRDNLKTEVKNLEEALCKMETQEARDRIRLANYYRLTAPSASTKGFTHAYGLILAGHDVGAVKS